MNLQSHTPDWHSSLAVQTVGSSTFSSACSISKLIDRESSSCLAFPPLTAPTLPVLLRFPRPNSLEPALFVSVLIRLSFGPFESCADEMAAAARKTVDFSILELEEESRYRSERPKVQKTCFHPGWDALARTWWISRYDAISNPAAAREPLVKRCAERPKKTPDGAVPVRRK